MQLHLLNLMLTTTLLGHSALAQTYSKCNPTEESGCPADPALGGATSIDFTSGPSSQFTASGEPTYSSNGVSFTVAQSGDAPELISNWYIMFGRYEVTMQAAPGQGIVSSVVLQSDDLDEIDWEWIGSEGTEGQTNYFGKGQATSYDRGGTSYVADAQSWHTYGVEWTEDQLSWSIDGTVVRTLTAADADGQYPQTPCQLKLGVWSGGDPSNAPGTIQWAGGPTDYAAGPYTMTVQSVSVVDYSTGTQYSYGGSSGSWTSIVASGGQVNGNAGGSLSSSESPSSSGSPSSSSTASAAVLPLASSSTSAAERRANAASSIAPFPTMGLLFSVPCSLIASFLLISLNILH